MLSRLSNRLFLILMCGSVAFLQFQQLKAQTLSSEKKNGLEKPFSFPLQLEMRVPFDPTVFPSGANFHLMYELYLTNFSSSLINLRSLELLDGDKKAVQSFVTFESAQLQSMLQPLGGNASGPGDKLSIAVGQTAIIFIEVISDRKKSFPNKLIHHIITETGSLNGAIISTHNSNLQLLGSPVRGTNWIAADGPGNDIDNHHRRGVIILDGIAVDSRRYAIDWKKVKDSLSYSGDPRNVQSYLCYGEKVFAVANGRVIRAKDGLPDNVPGHGKLFHPAVPLTFETLAGNNITIDLGNGHFAYYMHLQPGSLCVRVGEQVHKGQLIAKIGGSGDAREPHLHFEVTTSSKFFSEKVYPI